MSIDQLMGSLQAHEEKLLKKNKQMTAQLFQSKLNLKDKDDNLEKGNRGRGRGGNRGRGDFKDRGRGSYSQRKFDESNLTSNSSRGRGRQHYSRSSGERSNNDRSGVNNHMCRCKSMFVELDESVGCDIVFGDATKIPVKGKARKNMVKGLSYVKHPDPLCEDCLHGKQSRKSFPQESSSKARRPLELVHTDLCRPIKPTSFGNGICRPMTVPFTPQQNGVVERKNRTILNMVRRISLWNKTPKQAWTGRKPSIGHLRVFRCMAYAHIPNQKHSKLDDKSEKYVFVGYDASSKGYKLYNPITKKTIVSRDVVFDEEASWNWNDELDDYKFLFFPNDHDKPSDIASPSTPPTMPITPQQSTSSPFASSSEVPRGMRSLRDIYDETEELSQTFNNLTLFLLFDDSEPLNFEEASQNDKWKITMDEEIKAIKNNDTWELSTFVNAKKAVGVK
ncbi:T26F17.17 [Cucumis melo var. makuwa]|uniref:T26F17.17 n=1 Tax=Cucumis melo var. makuwa TaxID=1194695 RepID=A0A5A7SP85_CUCMM|nr:T26F17.17 [Cucumis melo var. makuwa]